jgi:hypothetical protein
MKKAILCAVLLASPGAAAHAQESGVKPAPTVRVLLRNQDRVQGFLRGRSADELVVYTSDRAYRRVPFSEVRRFEIQGRVGNHWKQGLLIGLLMAGGVVVTAPFDSLNDAGVASWQSAAVVGAGAVLGAGIGSTIPRNGWREADPRTSWGTAAPAAGVRITLRF